MFCRLETHSVIRPARLCYVARRVGPLFPSTVRREQQSPDTGRRARISGARTAQPAPTPPVLFGSGWRVIAGAGATPENLTAGRSHRSNLAKHLDGPLRPTPPARVRQQNGQMRPGMPSTGLSDRTRQSPFGHIGCGDHPQQRKCLVVAPKRTRCAVFVGASSS